MRPPLHRLHHKGHFLTEHFFTAVFDAYPEGDYPVTFEDRISQLRKPSLEEGLNPHLKTCEDLELCLIPLHESHEPSSAEVE